MTANIVARHYAELTPEERFRLILAAGARGDDAEQARLKAAGERITLSMPDHSPYGHAFDELATLVFLELVEEASKHDDAFHRLCDVEETWTDEDDSHARATGEGDGDDDVDATDDLESTEGDLAPEGQDGEDPIVTRARDLYLAQGFMLKTKLDGWKLFCERLSIPPFAIWEVLPGFDRFRRTVDRLEDNEFRPGPAFRPEGMLSWLSTIRPEGDPEPLMEQMISPDRISDGLDEFFRKRVEWWGGATP